MRKGPPSLLWVTWKSFTWCSVLFFRNDAVCVEFTEANVIDGDQYWVHNSLLRSQTKTGSIWGVISIRAKTWEWEWILEVLEESGSGMGQKCAWEVALLLPRITHFSWPQTPGFTLGTTAPSLSDSSSDRSAECVPDLTNQGRNSLLGNNAYSVLNMSYKKHLT